MRVDCKDNVEMWLVLELKRLQGVEAVDRFWEVIGPVSLVAATTRGCSIYIIVMSFFWIIQTNLIKVL